MVYVIHVCWQLASHTSDLRPFSGPSEKLTQVHSRPFSGPDPSIPTNHRSVYSDQSEDSLIGPITSGSPMWGTVSYLRLSNTALQQVAEFIVVFWLYSESLLPRQRTCSLRDITTSVTHCTTRRRQSILFLVGVLCYFIRDNLRNPTSASSWFYYKNISRCTVIWTSDWSWECDNLLGLSWF